MKNDFVLVAEASHSHIHIWVGAVDPKSWEEIDLQDFCIQLVRGKNQMEESFFFSFELKEGCLTFVILKIQYYRLYHLSGLISLNHPDLHPSTLLKLIHL